MILTRPDELRIDLPLQAIADICQAYGVSELAIFGSALRDDFDPDKSDIDLLVRFIDNDAGDWGCKYTQMREALTQRLGRKVDIVSWRAIEESTNPYRRSHILNNARRVYANR